MKECGQGRPDRAPSNQSKPEPKEQAKPQQESTRRKPILRSFEQELADISAIFPQKSPKDIRTEFTELCGKYVTLKDAMEGKLEEKYFEIMWRLKHRQHIRRGRLERKGKQPEDNQVFPTESKK